MVFNTSKLVEFLKRYDFSFFMISSAIFLIGVINLYSATHSSPHLSDLYQAQIGWYILSLVVGIGVSFVNTKTFYRYSYFFYALIILFLVAVLVIGHQGMGAQRWILIGPVRFQPSEIMKVALVLALARWFAKNDPDHELGMRQLIVPSLIALVPTLLIVLEPDLGTGLLTLLIFGVMIFYRKLKWKTMGILVLIGLISGGAMYQFGLKDYQKRRIATFLDPDQDTQGSGYNAIQSKIAIGSGRFLGKGFKNSSQASLNYLPENHTDFVFSVFNEEHGFFGSVFLVSLYLLLMLRFLWLASSVNRIFDSIVVIGLMSIYFWHTFINMGMVMGLMPIVGLPLPLMSYGGSSLMTFGICNGIATSISNSRNLF